MRAWLVGAALVLALGGCTAVVPGTGTLAGSVPSTVAASPTVRTPSGSGSGRAGLVRFRGNGFSILLPGAPARDEVPVTAAGGKITVTAHLLTVEIDRSHGYAFAYADYPQHAALTLEGAVRGAAAKVGGTAVDIKAVTYRGAPGRDFRVESANGFTLFSRILVVDRRMYQLEFVEQGFAGTVPPAQFITIERSLRF